MKRSRLVLGLALSLVCFPAFSGPSPGSGIFPFDVGIEVLPNGFKVVTVPVNPSKEISFFTIFRRTGGAGFDRGDAAEARLLTRIGAETRRVIGEDYTGDFVSFCGRENLSEVVRVEAARVRRMSAQREGSASSAFPGAGLSPAETILLVTGDFNREELLPLVRNSYGGWKTAGTVLETSSARAETSGIRPDILDAPGRTGVRLAFSGPAFSDREIDKAALDLLAAAAFSPSSPLARKLVLEDGRCLSLRAEFADRRSAGAFVILAEAKDERDRSFIEDAITIELARLRAETLSPRVLADAVSNRKSALAASIGTTGAVARVLAHYLSLTGDPGTIDRLFALYERITPLDVKAMVLKYLGPENLLPGPEQGRRP